MVGKCFEWKIQVWDMILVTGAAGQLGTDVVSELKRRGTEHIGIDVAELDITDSAAVVQLLTNYKPSCIIHCAAYTAVDKAEDEPDICNKINITGTENIILACVDVGAKMMYISTDYVFDGSGDTPFETDAPKNALSVYGRSKSIGEDLTIQNLDRYYIVRISGVFGKYGNNIAKTFQRLSIEREELSVVNDQIGSPTYTADLAVLLCDIILSDKYGIYHATNEGHCSWAQFAEEVVRITGNKCKINPIPSEQYPTKARRPKNWRLSKQSLDDSGFNRLPTWQDALIRFFNE